MQKTPLGSCFQWISCSAEQSSAVIATHPANLWTLRWRWVTHSPQFRACCHLHAKFVFYACLFAYSFPCPPPTPLILGPHSYSTSPSATLSVLGSLLKKKQRIYLLIFGYDGSSLLHRPFSSCSKWGLLSSCGAQASHCGGFSCCRAWALGLAGFSSCSVWAQ